MLLVLVLACFLDRELTYSNKDIEFPQYQKCQLAYPGLYISYLFFSNRPGDKLLREMEIKEFYKSYDAYEGALTAIVLGGFFAFVCLLVMYKTKCKPMWKNRRKRLTTTPATASVAELDDPIGQLGAPAVPPVIQQG